jgi:hypothetical protein
MKLRSGTALIIALAAVLAGGWFLYRHFIPPRWLHNFVADVALRGAPDPNAPPPRDTRQATPRGLAKHPFICMRKLVPFTWDRMVVVPSGNDPRDVPILRDAAWQNDALEKFAQHMAADNRYQLIVLLDGRKVLASEPFFNFWADLTALGTPDGYSPETAVFTAVVKDGRYVLSPVNPPYPAECS